MKRVLVTGGAGFLGSHMCAKLLDDGVHIICVDNFSTSNKVNITCFFEYDHFELIEHDVSLPIVLEVDEIYNFACPASPYHYQKSPVNTMKSCFLGTMNMLDLAKANQAKLFQASTSEIYGDPKVHPQPESYWGNVNPVGSRSCYNEAKRSAESLCLSYRQQYNIDSKIARIFNTYGPNMQLNDGRVVSNFIASALKGENITVYGDGMQTRSFCYVDDLIEGCARLMVKNVDVTGPVNLGSVTEITIRQLAETILNLTGSSSKLVFTSLPEDDPLRRQPDITLANKLLDWQPIVQLEQGLIKTVEYFDALLSKNA